MPSFSASSSISDSTAKETCGLPKPCMAQEGALLVYTATP